MEVVMTAEALRRAMLQSNRHRQLTDTQLLADRMPLTNGVGEEDKSGTVGRATDSFIFHFWHWYSLSWKLRDPGEFPLYAMMVRLLGSAKVRLNWRHLTMD